MSIDRIKALQLFQRAATSRYNSFPVMKHDDQENYVLNYNDYQSNSYEFKDIYDINNNTEEDTNTNTTNNLVDYAIVDSAIAG